MPSHIDSLVHSLSVGKGFTEAMGDVNARIQLQKEREIGKVKEGSCGNGSAMRVAPLGAFLAPIWHGDDENWSECSKLCDYEKRLVAEAALQAEVTHCHPEGIAGAIAITSLAHNITELMMEEDPKYGLNYPNFDRILYQNLLRRVPQGQVRDGIVKAKDLAYDMPIGKVIQVLGNGTHVTCQDTVPLCCYLAIKHLALNKKSSDLYEKAIIETSMAFGDVDTNCAIVGGVIGIVCPPPDKWSQFCKPMEGVCHCEIKYTPNDIAESVTIPVRV
jgi:ADP-ribosylglycohydrolase